MVLILASLGNMVSPRARNKLRPSIPGGTTKATCESRSLFVFVGCSEECSEGCLAEGVSALLHSFGVCAVVRSSALVQAPRLTARLRLATRSQQRSHQPCSHRRHAISRKLLFNFLKLRKFFYLYGYKVKNWSVYE